MRSKRSAGSVPVRQSRSGSWPTIISFIWFITSSKCDNFAPVAALISWMASLAQGRGSVIVFGLLLALFLLLITRTVSWEPYVYDEADYMYAASLGFAANWSDTHSIPISDFARTGLARERRQ